MRDTDVRNFSALMRRLTVLRKMDVSELQAQTSSYFRALQRHDLGDLERAADRWLETKSVFPKPADLGGLVREVRRPQPSPLRELTGLEARDWLKAEQLRWQDTPCVCDECRSHGVADEPIRFVPLLDEHDREIHARIGDRVVTQGEWIHGAPLMRWYRAREDFFAKWRSWAGQSFQRVTRGVGDRGART